MEREGNLTVVDTEGERKDRNVLIDVSMEMVYGGRKLKEVREDKTEEKDRRRV